MKNDRMCSSILEEKRYGLMFSLDICVLTMIYIPVAVPRGFGR